MEQEIIKRLEKIEEDLIEIKQDFEVYNHTADTNHKMVRVQIEVLKNYVEKCCNYKDYFDKFSLKNQETNTL